MTTNTRIKITAAQFIAIRALTKDIELRLDSAGCDIAEEVAIDSGMELPDEVDSDNSPNWDAFFEMSSDCFGVILDMVIGDIKKRLC